MTVMVIGLLTPTSKRFRSVGLEGWEFVIDRKIRPACALCLEGLMRNREK